MKTLFFLVLFAGPMAMAFADSQASNNTDVAVNAQTSVINTNAMPICSVICANNGTWVCQLLRDSKLVRGFTFDGYSSQPLVVENLQKTLDKLESSQACVSAGVEFMGMHDYFKRKSQ